MRWQKPKLIFSAPFQREKQQRVFVLRGWKTEMKESSLIKNFAEQIFSLHTAHLK
jgi:hypothetical protein